MRFAHRRRMDEGEFASAKGGFFATPPQTPPPINGISHNDLPPREGELGGFSQPLHVEDQYQLHRGGYVDHPAGASATCTSTSPTAALSRPRSLIQGEKEGGGVCGETPPVGALDPLDQVISLPAEVISGLRDLRARPAPIISHPSVWREIVNDALTLATSGLARRALDQGWDALDVFGVGVTNSNEFEGLAVWLAGRDVIEISEWKAHTACGATFYREASGRPNSPCLPNVPLWLFGSAKSRLPSAPPSASKRRTA